MIQITISGENKEELSASLQKVAELLGSTSAAAVLSGSDQARLRGNATVVAPKEGATKELSAAEKKAAKKLADEAAAKKAADEAEAETEADAEDDPLGENDEADATEETLTHDDVKKLLIELRSAYPTDKTILSRVVKDFGKTAKISDVEEKHLSAVANETRRLLKAAPKKK